MTVPAPHPKHCRRIYRLHHVYALPVAEIADELKMPLAAVRAALDWVYDKQVAARNRALSCGVHAPLRPKHSKGEYGSREWFESNDQAFRQFIKRAGAI